MGLFSPSKDSGAAADTPAAPPQRVPAPTGAKSAPTPKRKDAEAARRQLSPKEAKQRARQDAAVERRRQSETMDSTPGKKLIRNWIDSRSNLAEWTMPILMMLLLIVLVVSPMYPAS